MRPRRPHSCVRVMVAADVVELRLSLGKPDGAPAAAGIFGDVRENAESMLRQQRPIFRSRQAGVIEGFTLEAAKRLAIRRTAGEKQPCPGGGVRLKHRKHPALIRAGQMEEAIPGHHTVKASSQLQSPHIGLVRPRRRQSRVKQRQHGCRGIDPGDHEAAIGELTGDRDTGAAAQIQYLGARGKPVTEAIKPGALYAGLPPAQFVPSQRMPLIEGNDAVGQGVAHGPATGPLA